jgi:WD40 repeat protein
MLWDVVMSDEWNSDTTRNVLSQWAARESESEVPDSPTGRRRKLMAKIAAGGPVNRQDVEELGVDLNTEYTRWWVDDDGEVEQARSSSSKWGRLAAKKKVTISLPPPSIDIQNETVSSPQSRPSLTSPKLSPPTSPKTQKTPLSPVSRSRRQSTLFEEEPRVLRATRDTRQFEFHPFDPNLMITGSRSGVITLIDAEHDLALMETRVDSSPILGLSWLRAHMNMALYGASSSGLVGIVKVGTTKIDYQPIGRFQNLSSVSINCTDDYFIVSGFSRDVSLFDLVSGKKVSEFKEIHSNFINITRFANFSPHLLATSSFDSTCKLWDLRKPATSAVASYTTPSLNVMCCFSPLDENLLVSGLDANLVQLSVKTGLKPNIRQEVLTASVQARNSSSNYRRAVYTADGSRFITSGTDENFMRVIDSTTGASHGICRFDGLLDTFEERLKLKTPGYKAVKQDFGPHAGIAEPGSGKTTEYIQSLRGHPIFTKEVGVLLYPFDRTRSSFVCTTKIPVSTAN